MSGFLEIPDQKQLLMKIHVQSDYHDFGWAKFVFEIVKKKTSPGFSYRIRPSESLEIMTKM